MTGFPVERYLTAVEYHDEHDEDDTASGPARFVQDVMTDHVVAVAEATPFKDIARIIERYRVHTLPVIDDHRRVVGVVTASDLLARVAGIDAPMPSGERPRARRLTGAEPRALTGGELMTAPPITVKPDTPIVVAARLAARARVRSLPVVDEAGTLVGIVTRGDLVKVFLRKDRDIEGDVRAHAVNTLSRGASRGVAVGVRAGVVTLFGHVASSSDARSLERKIRAVPGVVDVCDELDYRDDSDYDVEEFWVP